jgi:hypothetical protein
LSILSSGGIRTSLPISISRANYYFSSSIFLRRASINIIPFNILRPFIRLIYASMTAFYFILYLLISFFFENNAGYILFPFISVS